MRVELFYTPGCKKCAGRKDALRATAEELVPGLVWRELNVLAELDYAIELGVLTLPAVAIEGNVVFSALPTQRQFRRELMTRIGKGA